LSLTIWYATAHGDEETRQTYEGGLGGLRGHTSSPRADVLSPDSAPFAAAQTAGPP